MNEQDIKDLGFEIQHETAESSGSDKDWHYYTIDIGDICLITNDSDQAIKEGWSVSIFDSETCIIKSLFDLKTLISILKINTPLK
ncbi:MAG: hypothetical protein HQ473_07340 [Cryomorphaceae bacterium]|nr:hypothetical protein [Cryomorphaceae bacterium]